MAGSGSATTAPPAVGILRPEVQDALVRRDRLEPAAGLEPWVEHYWTVAWELDDPGFVAEVVSHPSVHVTVESGDRPRFGHVLPAGLVHGVITRRFSQQIAGTGRVFGVKFRPGGFGAFTGADVGAWTDRVLPLAVALGDGPTGALVREVLALDRTRTGPRWPTSSCCPGSPRATSATTRPSPSCGRSRTTRP